MFDLLIYMEKIKIERTVNGILFFAYVIFESEMDYA